ncbi:MAG: MBL fold metallo-hydrolase [Bacteroidia bacterium]|jgi:glyoxylase-like metal-dependent hydrolase (beta-lactamase superfamily II)|nr:MBL fold metallo-hydrolase [Bacteroidia bacterium]MDG2041691.1 MBL fold metallo-hydrolase [Bacteroidia bacterium]|tara:strand:+ start:8698 stop:9339 length:642 start_codon:yes stop_codon:yes gene_type:complete
MTRVYQLTYGPFAENTYVIADDDLNAIIIDPGMYHPEENAQFFEFINSHQLKPCRLLLTHAHLDHVFGVNWINKTYGLTPEIHFDDQIVYESAVVVAKQYGLNMNQLVPSNISLIHNQVFKFGGSEFRIIHTPGHSPGSVCFRNDNEGYVISGDVLFQGSIGRTDLPGGDFNVLIRSINEHIINLAEDTIVYSGHGPVTTVGQEKISNPFLQA